jgi:hypothetical protein
VLVAGALSAVLLLVAAGAAQAATFTVNTTSDNAPTAGECSGAAGDCSLRQAIDASNATSTDDTINVPAGTYHLTIAGTDEDLNLTGDLDVNKLAGSVTIAGAGARSTIVDATGLNDRVLQIVTGTATVSGLTLTGGDAAASGSEGGGGVENDGTLTLDQTIVSGNSANWGGGVYNNSSVASPAVALTVSNSTISGNTARYYGSGMDFDDGDAQITNTTISGNTNLNATPSGTGDAGAIETDSGNLTFTNDTIANNRVTDTSGNPSTNPTDAGGVELYDVTSAKFQNTIVANNSPSDCHIRAGGFLPGAGVNMDSDSTCFNGASDKHGNPQLGPLQDNGAQTDTMALLDGSPAINSADNSICPATDQRGVTRPQPASGTCDIGAYEAQPPDATTGAASGVTTNSATLNGTVNPQNLATTFHFEYGTTTSYGTSTPDQSAGADRSAHPESAAISGLAPNTTYHFRIVATNAIGTTFGADQVFTTNANPPAAVTPPAVVTGPATNIGSRAATVNGSVNPNGVAATYHFDYGTSTSYGHSSTSQSAGSGNAPVSVSARLSGLQPGAIYHYRLVAANSGGTTSGGDRTFSTKAVIVVAGASSSCVRAGRASVRVRITSLLRPGVTITIGGRRVASGSGRSFTIKSALARLKPGGHRIVITARSSAGTTRRTVGLRICATVRPRVRFTG